MSDSPWHRVKDGGLVRLDEPVRFHVVDYGDRFSRLWAVYLGRTEEIAQGTHAECEAELERIADRLGIGLSDDAKNGPKWQPIETAPRYGIPILCLSPTWQISIGTCFRDGKWYSAEGSMFASTPVMWMPLPERPALEAG